MCRTFVHIKTKGTIGMTTSNAKRLEELNRARRITVSSNSAGNSVRTSKAARSDKSLRPQKLVGGIVLAVSLAAAAFGGELSAAAVMAPPALAAVFSKEKLLDFGIFGKN